MSDRTQLATDPAVGSRMSAMLAVLQRSDANGEAADNESVAVALGWNLDETAVIVHSARESLLVWGMREGRKPGPWYSSLELTVQGRRYLRNNA